MKSPVPYIEMAVEAGKRVLQYAPETEGEFQRSPVIQDAICMRLQEMGENLSKVRQHFPDFYEAHHSDDWHRLIGLRNAISHGYGEIDMHIVWRIVSTELQQVVDALARLNHSEHA